MSSTPAASGGGGGGGGGGGEEALEPLSLSDAPVGPSAFGGWLRYFSTPPLPEVTHLALMRHFYAFFAERKATYAQVDFADAGSIAVDVASLLEALQVPQLRKRLVSTPAEFLSLLGVAAHQLFIEEASIKRSFYRPLQVRLFNLEPVRPLKQLKSNLINNFVCVRGAVIRVGIIKPLAVRMPFTCVRCGEVSMRQFADGKYNPPSACGSAECRSRTFVPDRTRAITVDFQKIRVQEILGDDAQEAGRMPRTLDVELTDDLVDSCVPGDIVTVCGIVKVASMMGDGPAGRAQNKQQTMFLLYVDANSVYNNKQMDSNNAMVQFSLKDMYAIQEIANDPNLLHLIVNSVCPSIYGHELVKAGLALSLFSGCQRYVDSKNKLSVRADPHVLVVGDPGLGKSQMLRAVSAIAPRGVYVSGNTTTSSGLTVTVVRDAGSGDFALEAGALVLGDQGCCAIDEFDKMGIEHQSLLEAMEQQSISVAKAGIVCNLPTRTCVIAAANPVGGHYNRAKTVSENLKMSPTILSRFDLIFILLDRPDEEKDMLLSEHVIRLHSGREGVSFSQLENGAELAGAGADGMHMSLAARLRSIAVPDFEPIPAVLLRKYIAYARKYVSPKITSEAGAVLQQFYLDLRRQHRSPDSIPITTRQFESLIRLAEARAKLELREFVTEADAQDVVTILKESLFDLYCDQYGQVDFSRATGMSKSREVRRFVAELTRIAEVEANSMFSRQDLFDIARSLQIPLDQVDMLVDTMNTQGFLLQRAGRRYQLQTSQYPSTPHSERPAGRGRGRGRGRA